MNSWWQQLKNIYHFWQAHFWRIWYGRPERFLHLYGVTGTNGKTTTCYLLASILSKHVGEAAVGMLTTVALRVGQSEQINKTKLTTLPSRKVYQYLRKMKVTGVKHAVIEITSHALDQRRLAGMRLDGAAILNIEREHLDYHETMEEYARAKGLIIDYLKPKAPLIGKADDKLVAKILDSARQRGFSVHSFTSLDAESATTSLAGKVNRENAWVAQLLALAIKIPTEEIDEGLKALKKVPGRMEWIENDKGFRVLIDYAVTPDALRRLYRDIRSQTTGRIFGILGAAGLRDRGKRPLMAQAVANGSDLLILTREDPWTENEEQIFSDLESGLKTLKKNWLRVIDRRAAIKMALEKARPGDVVVITGKGAEVGMAIGKKIIPWSDKQVVQDILKSYEIAFND